MTHRDHHDNQRRDSIIVGMLIDEAITIDHTICCNDTDALAVLGLGTFPMQLEIVADSTVTLTRLIAALTAARDALSEHNIHHDTHTAANSDEPLFVPDDWTGKDNQGGEHR